MRCLLCITIALFLCSPVYGEDPDGKAYLQKGREELQKGSYDDAIVSLTTEIGHVSGILSEKLSDEPEKLIADLEDVECWNSRIGALLAQADSWLDRYKFLLMPSREGRTEADRKAELDHLVSPIRLLRDTLDRFCDAIKQRLILGESVLSYHKNFADRNRKVANLDPF